MPEPVDVRRLRALELADYKALRDAMLAAHPEAFTSDAEAEAAKPAQAYLPRLGLDRPQGGHFTLGAWNGRSLVGALSCERDMRLKVRHVGHLIGMMVVDHAAGRGIGKRLLQECIALARAADGLELLTLSVTAGNAAAEHLYHRVGFVRYGTQPRAVKLDGRYHDKHQMILSL
jgi:RimJ/RimL family protein N-acetyltransferase